ncbi:MAG: hypothetical protein COV33_01895 [Candidatus Zambryskibacteria bacterium CG10_big_fil_rev_8_21_14_0_10_34_34]|uniref:Uncharacterized protein n=1 Tax=Candidatus Zambryskibacteria bacterium CG10_big_fil_rev_8_21_14_0_10_34_34 TaxID=1975114 RepID=A0A2H0R1E0_9BACT|nr:MAG: hypothetical protein COV33_01895 [Candidatus Zambryskibacteria bacterium CG10_big_fil_rev_8_21_14_0_10_34_34]
MLLLTQEEYSKLKHKTPYVYKIQNKKQFLYYFGERHSFDPKNKQWIQVKEFWFDFIKNTENSKRIAFVEAGNPSLKETEEKSILEAGGTGLIVFLSSQSKTEVYCPEPNRTYEMMELEKQFSKEEIEYYYFARIVYQWSKIPDPKPKFEEYIIRFLERDKKMSDWNDFDFSFENLKIVHKKLFDTEFDLEDLNFFKDLVTPVELKTVINRVARASGEIRNEYIIKEIQKYWNNGYSIFIEYGASHAVIQESLLKEILK